MTWQSIRLELARTPDFPDGSASRAYLLRLPLHRDGLIDEEALADAVHVAALFSMIVRLADSFGWHVPPTQQFDARAPQMLESGYTLLTGDTGARS